VPALRLEDADAPLDFPPRVVTATKDRPQALYQVRYLTVEQPGL